MANTAAVYARIDTNLKESAEDILAQLGITPSSAIQMLYRQIVLTRGVAAASSGTAHFSSSAWVAASAPPRAPKYRAACARSMPSGFSSRSGILGPMLICPPSFTRIKNRFSIQHRGPAVNDFKFSNFFAINLLTIWVNGDIIQTTNPPT